MEVKRIAVAAALAEEMCGVRVKRITRGKSC